MCLFLIKKSHMFVTENSGIQRRNKDIFNQAIETLFDIAVKDKHHIISPISGT